MELHSFIQDREWSKRLTGLLSSPKIIELQNFLAREYRDYTIYPAQEQIFTALNLTPFQSVKVVILGQDPYHGPGQAHGLAFSVKESVPPPSLKNIFKELKISPDNGDLTSWAEQGVLLLNTVLTVRQGEANSHQKKGWELLTDKMIQLLSAERDGLVFLLWGASATAKKSQINIKKHYVLEAAHPSPLSAYRGFFGCRHFDLVNKYLIECGQSPINWQIPAKSTQLEFFL